MKYRATIVREYKEYHPTRLTRMIRDRIVREFEANDDTLAIGKANRLVDEKKKAEIDRYSGVIFCLEKLERIERPEESTLIKIKPSVT